ncbi:hypothetical protein [Lysobacter gummosus]|uniref:Uncharacterized protein n=1 Tax=Lysobacter gummosus TaxID=262324 RepID=A0ABY3XJQ3_9GAMM|nr:hypothetical protein [Lysobacter gummosus]ALN91508.1 hypothetical protein LG3211_2541 [Lysobacter gummosus]UNP31874.1 hypothetical protein MOV92_11735 [Lysobacter gummosus]
MAEKLPWLSTLSSVGFQLTSAIEIEFRGNLTFSEVYRGIDQGTLLQDIDRKLPGVCDFSLYPPGSEQCAALLESLKRAAGGLQGCERRKAGLISSGLHLIIALVFEAIQQRYWVDPREV